MDLTPEQIALVPLVTLCLVVPPSIALMVYTAYRWGE